MTLPRNCELRIANCEFQQSRQRAGIAGPTRWKFLHGCSTASIITLIAILLVGGCTSQTVSTQVATEQAIIDARDTLRQAAEDKDPVVHANAIEALSQTVGDKEGGLYVQALSDRSPLVQFAAAMAIGDVKYMPAKPALQRMAAVQGPDKRAYAGVIYALHQLGDSGHTQDLARLMSHRESEVRAVTALVLGKLGEPSAIYMLKSRLGDEREAKVELQLVESLATLGDPVARGMLEGYTKRPFLDDRLVAIPALARLRADHAIVVLTELTSSNQPIPVRVAAAGGLARLGDVSDARYRMCVQAAANPMELSRSLPWAREDLSPADVALIQRLGAISLGWMNRPTAAPVLHSLLRSEDGTIRVAAAMSILRLLAPYYTPREVLSPAEAEVKAPATARAATVPAAASSPAATGRADEPQTRPETVIPKLPRLESSGPKE